MKEGNFTWAQPQNIFLGAAAIGGKLGMPPHFPVRNAPAGFGSYEYGIGFRFAEAAHPTRIVLQTAGMGDLAFDLTAASQTIPEPSPAEVKAHPLNGLSALAVNDANVNFSWDGTCVWRIENLVRNKVVYLPYTLVNKHSLDEQQVAIPFPHAVYEPGGVLHYWEDPIALKVGPGQTVRDMFVIDLRMNETDPLPTFLVDYADDGGTTAFQLNCTELKQ
ncbi:MAG: hypothetical protein M1482_01255 [Chloroflexi bacterium]|nr:hypothetical protein [Chloroflexota bacterium]